MNKAVDENNKISGTASWNAPLGSNLKVGAGLAALLLVFVSPRADALNLYDGASAGNNLEVNLTTTVSYTGMYRVNSPSAVLKPGEDGDANFRHGIVGNLFEAVPVLDIRDGNFGAHFSGQDRKSVV